MTADGSGTTSSEERDAATFAADLQFRDIPPENVEHASLLVADSLGAIIGGVTTPYVAEFAERSCETRDGQASILGTARRTSGDRAALVNGCAGSVLEVDEGHKYAAGHPAMHVLPALFAEAESGIDPTGERFVTALVAGYEVGARVGIACTPLDDDYHMHGVWGTVGAAAAVARLRNFDPETTLAAMRIGANHALHTCFDAALEGATVRNTYMGMSAMNGILAADQAASGFSGLTDGLARHLERTTAEGFDDTAVAAGLGERWEFTRGYFKIHAACRYTHGALDAIDSLESDYDFEPADVTGGRIETYPAAARLTNPRPTNDLEAKFSIPFAVATRLVRGDSDKTAFSESALESRTYELAEAFELAVADDLARRVPEARSTRVTLSLTGGRELTTEIRHPRGGEANRLSRTDLRDKFETLVRPVLGDSTVDLWTVANDLPETTPTSIVAMATTRS